MSSADEPNVSREETPPVITQPSGKAGWSEHHPHAWVLLICVAILALSFWLSIDTNQDVVVPWLNVALPQTCMFRNLTSLNCPGCGLTRSFISLADGRWHAAWKFNPVGWMIFVLVAAQIPFRTLQLARLKSGRAALTLPGTVWLCWILMILLLTQWLVRGMGRW